MKVTEDPCPKVKISQQVFTALVQFEAVTGIPRQKLIDEAIEWFVEACVSSYAEEVAELAGRA